MSVPTKAGVEAQIEPQDYRAAMRQFPAAVHVATTDGHAGRRGITVSAATSVSDRPPTVLICVNRDHSQNQFFKSNGCFALNTLSVAQLQVARAFANGALSSDERFSHGLWDTLQTGAPCLQQAAIVFDCEIVDSADVATHTVLYGRIRALRFDDAAQPLLYANRQYLGLGSVIE
jgi:cob(II)yrinic acid a,c-diamide reductase